MTARLILIRTVPDLAITSRNAQKRARRPALAHGQVRMAHQQSAPHGRAASCPAQQGGEPTLLRTGWSTAASAGPGAVPHGRSTAVNAASPRWWLGWEARHGKSKVPQFRAACSKELPIWVGADVGDWLDVRQAYRILGGAAIRCVAGGHLPGVLRQSRPPIRASVAAAACSAAASAAWRPEPKLPSSMEHGVAVCTWPRWRTRAARPLFSPCRFYQFGGRGQEGRADGLRGGCDLGVAVLAELPDTRPGPRNRAR